MITFANKNIRNFRDITFDSEDGGSMVFRNIGKY